MVTYIRNKIMRNVNISCCRCIYIEFNRTKINGIGPLQIQSKIRKIKKDIGNDE